VFRLNTREIALKTNPCIQSQGGQLQQQAEVRWILRGGGGWGGGFFRVVSKVGKSKTIPSPENTFTQEKIGKNWDLSYV